MKNKFHLYWNPLQRSWREFITQNRTNGTKYLILFSSNCHRVAVTQNSFLFLFPILLLPNFSFLPSFFLHLLNLFWPSSSSFPKVNQFCYFWFLQFKSSHFHVEQKRQERAWQTDTSGTDGKGEASMNTEEWYNSTFVLMECNIVKKHPQRVYNYSLCISFYM